MSRVQTWEVHALKYAHLPRLLREVSIFADAHDGSLAPMDYFVWAAIPLGEDGQRLIGGKPIVIDTGFGTEEGERRGRKMIALPDKTLARIGVDAAAVEDVVITHLHYDHVGNWHLFPKARFHLQEAEMQFVTGKHMKHGAFRMAYNVEEVVAMVRQNFAGRLTFHTGDAEIAPGLSVHLIGGHTMGIQCVRINTRNGPLVLASDTSHYYWGIEKRELFHIVFNVSDMLNGYDKLESLANGDRKMVVPGHDADVFNRYPVSAPGMEGVGIRLD